MLRFLRIGRDIVRHFLANLGLVSPKVTEMDDLMVWMPPETLNRLKHVQRKLGADSPTHAMSVALRVSESLADHLHEGSAFSLRRRDGEIFDVEFPFTYAGRGSDRPVLKLVVNNNAT